MGLIRGLHGELGSCRRLTLRRTGETRKGSLQAIDYKAQPQVAPPIMKGLEHVVDRGVLGWVVAFAQLQS